MLRLLRVGVLPEPALHLSPRLVGCGFESGLLALGNPSPALPRHPLVSSSSCAVWGVGLCLNVLPMPGP